MKNLLSISLVVLGLTFAASAFSAETAAPKKTVLKTNHSALCNAPQGKTSNKNCPQTTGTPPVRH